MNTEAQAIVIAKRIGSLIDPNKGVLKVTLYNPSQTLEVKVKRFYTEFNSNGFSGELITFTSDINNLTAYSIYNIKEVS